MTLYDDNNQPVHEPSAPLLPDHTVQWIFDPDGKEPPFAYTVGLAARPGRAYELANVGLPMRLAHAVITAAAEQLVTDGLDPAEGLELDAVLRGGYVVRLRSAEDTSGCTAARAAFGPHVPVWQILTPDAQGSFPGDPLYAEPAAQPLL